MKKLLALTLSMTMALGLLAGCVQSTPAPNDTQNPPADLAKDPTADQSLQYVLDKGSFIIGLDDTFPPMGFRDDKNNIVGFDIDVATEVAAILGVKLEMQPIEWTAKEQELATKRIDAIWNGFSKDAEREKALNLSIPYMDNNMALVVKDPAIKTKADLAGKKIAIQGGSSAEIALDTAADFKATLSEIVPFTSNTTALVELETENVSAVLMDSVVADYIITTNKKPFTLLAEVISTEEYVIGMRKGDDALTTAINEALKQLKDNGKLAEIGQKWFGADKATV